MNISDINNDGIAMDGVDPVSYYNGEPLRGTSDFRASVGNQTFYFSSKENMEKFENEPAKFIPMAGGYPDSTKITNQNLKQTDKGYIGGNAYTRPTGLEDSPVSIENNVPTDIKEDGSVEMQNLSDSEQ